MEIKDYPEDLDESEYQHFSGAIIVIAMIAICGVIAYLAFSGVL